MVQISVVPKSPPRGVYYHIGAQKLAKMSDDDDDDSTALESLVRQRLQRAFERRRFQVPIRNAAVPIRKQCVRRGGWNPKPRSGATSPSKQHTQDEWRFDTSKCIWWELLNDADTLVDRSYAAQAFHNEFRMPRRMFDQLVLDASVNPKFTT